MTSWRARLAWRGPEIARFAITLVALVLVAGCGQGSQGNQGNASSPRGSASEPTATASPAARATSIATPAHTTSGQVRVTMSKSHYDAEEPLVATISNGLGQTIWISTDRASCLGVVLQIQTTSGWQAAGNCAAARSPQPTAIPSGGTLVKQFTYPQGADSGAGWPAGAYRVLLPYSMSQSAATAAGTTVSSSVFTIG